MFELEIAGTNRYTLSSELYITAQAPPESATASPSQTGRTIARRCLPPS